jgi:hypothetical protein
MMDLTNFVFGLSAESNKGELLRIAVACSMKKVATGLALFFFTAGIVYEIRFLQIQSFRTFEGKQLSGSQAAGVNPRRRIADFNGSANAIQTRYVFGRHLDEAPTGL